MTRSRMTLFLASVALLVFVLGVVYGQLSPGTYQDDDIDRYAYARRVWSDPGVLLNRWAMPAALVVFAAPARIGGYAGVEVATALLAALAALATGLAAGGLGLRRPWLAAVFCAFQPLVLTLSFSALAEPVAGALLAAVLAAWYRNRPALAVGIAGFLPLARIDTAPLMLLVLAAAWLRLDWRSRILPLAPLLLWNLGGFLQTGEILFVVGESARPLASQGPDRYLRDLIVVLGPVVFFFVVWGAATGLSRAGQDGRLRPPRLALLLGVVHLALLSALSWEALPVGRSVGFLRHITATAPAWALVGAWGAETWLTGTRRRLPAIAAIVATGLIALFLSHRLVADTFVGEGRVEVRWVAAAALTVLGMLLPRLPRGFRRGLPGIVALAAVGFALATVRPIPLNAERRAVLAAVEQIESWGYGNSVVYANHVWFPFLSGRDRWDRTLTPPLTRESLRQAPPGALILWENHYGPRMFGDVPLGELRQDPSLRRVYEAVAGVRDTFRVVIFEKLQ